MPLTAEADFPTSHAIAADAVVPDLRDPALRSDPASLYRDWRARGPLLRDAQGLWLVTRHALARELMQDAAMSRDPRRWSAYAALRPFTAGSTLERSVERWMLFNDPPAHTRLRRLFGAAFTPAATRGLEDLVRETAARLVARLPAVGGFDLMRELAEPFPVRVIGALLGLPDEDFADTKAWSDALALVVEPASRRELRAASDEAAARMLSYLAEHLERRRHRPRDDLLGALLAAAGDDVDGETLLANLMLLFVAGHETTTNLVGNGLWSLLQHPHELARLRGDPALLPAAIEEMLRYEPPATMVARVARRPMVLAGRALAPGDMLYCLIGAANRDPAVFENPERFDVGRAHNPHLSFGGGVHYCLGAPLARLEARVVLETLLRRFDRIDAPDPTPRWRPLVNLRGLESLHLAVR